MNNRIKELMNQAWVQPTYMDCNGKECNHSPDVYPLYFSEEKFAELLLKEFSKQVQIEGRFGLENEQNLIRFCCENAKKHFGVE
jgi:hypothetical protein